MSSVSSYISEPLAVVGLSGRVSGCADLDGFWSLLQSGADAFTEMSPERRRLTGWPDGEPARSGFIDGVDEFDAAFFGISPREAEVLDPQQRLMLEVVWRLLEESGIRPVDLRGPRTGVWMGGLWHDYELLRLRAGSGATQHSIVGNSLDILSARLSYALGLGGPSLTVESSCSSSLVALHLAGQSLARGEVDTALVGSANLILTPQTSEGLGLFGGLSPTGACRPFGAGADGFVRGEGVLAIALKRLDDAVRDGVPVLAVLVASGMNNDGGGDSLVTPNGAAQADLLRAVYTEAGISADQVAYLEAHGTGTRRGDPTEAAAIASVLGRPDGPPLPIGSVKATIGHLEPAAGLAGLAKVLLAIRHGQLPPSRNAETLNPEIDFAGLGIEVARTERALAELPGRYFGVNSFGWGGTNAHVVLAGPPAAVVPEPPAEPVLGISARTPAALDTLVTESAGRFGAGLAASWAWHREPLDERLALVGAGSAEDISGIWSPDLPAGVLEQGAVTAVRGRARPVGRVGWVFPGQGSQWPGMAAGLYGSNLAFTERLDECAAALAPYLDRDLVGLLCDPSRTDWLDRVDQVQPALWAMSVSLAAAWRAAGVWPDLVIGHSQGEIAAATVAGLLSVADGASVVARRSRLLTRLAGRGRMLAVDLDAEAAARMLDGFEGLVGIAVHNGPRSSVLSGEADAVLLLKEILEAEEVFCRLVEVDYASHSPQIEEIAGEVEQALAGLRPRAGELPMFSTVDLDWLAGPELDGSYWTRNLRQPVRFADAVAQMIGDGLTHVIEVSPHPGLGVPIGQQAERLEAGLVVLPTLRRGAGRFEVPLAQAWVSGLPATGPRPAGPFPVLAPGYPLRPGRFWLDPAGIGATASGPLALRRTAVTGSREARFVLDATSRRWLTDHRVGDTVVLPAAVALAAVATVLPAGTGLRSIRFPEPLVVGEDDREVSLTVRDSADGSTVIRVGSESAADPDGSELSRAAVRHLTAVGVAEDAVLEDVGRPEPVAAPDERAETLDAAAFYTECAGRGLHYGPAFQGVTTLTRTPGRVLATVARPESAGQFPSGLHPVLWDAVLQAGLALDPASPDVLPYEIAEISIVRPVGDGPLQVTAAARDTGVELVVADRDGPALVLRGVRFAALTGAAAGTEDRWSMEFRASEDEPDEAAADDAPAVFELPGAAGQAVLVADGIVLSDLADLERTGAGRVVLLATGTDPAELAAVLAGTARALSVLARHSRPLQVDVVVRGAFAEPGPELVAGSEPEPVGRAVHGLVAVAHNEYSQLRLRLISLDAPGAALAQAARVSAAEDLISLSGQGIRLGRLVAGASAGPERSWVGAQPQPFRIATRRPGQLSSLSARLQPVAPPGAGQVQVRIEGAGLNFIDVLKALNSYPDAADPDPTRLGLEAAGVVSAVGAGVDEVAVGDRVVVCGPGGLASHRTADQRLVRPVPDHLALAQAAALPMAYLTAWYSLVDLAGLRAGQSVLIHSATGGVGLAALTLARQLGADVVATAGTEAKRARLAGLGVEVVLDSRSPDWASELLRARPGGVEVVLNSLPGRGLALGLEVLAGGGHLVELGKRDIHQAAALPLEVFAKGISFSTVDLAGLLRTDPDRFGRLLDDTWAAVSDGRLAALPVSEYPFAQADSAFAELSAGRHTGKLVLTEPASVTAVAPRPYDGSFPGGYLITGGLGVLGRSLAGWLIEHGAGRLALLGRSAPTAEVAAELAGWRAAGVDVRVYAADVSDRAALTGALADFRRTGPLTGVFHAAGILADATLDNLDEARLAAVLAPKVTGARLLDELTEADPIEQFVLFSSAATYVGSPGQGGYAAANGYLDGLALRRRAAGRAGLSVQWGPVTDAGLAVGADRGDRLAERGLAGVTAAECWAELDRLLRDGPALACFARLDGPRWAESYPATAARASWQPVLSGAGRRAAAGGGDGLRGLAGPELRDRLRTDIRLSAARILRMSEAELADDQPLKAQGLDSLMSLELRSALERVVGRQLSPTLLWKYTSVAEVAGALAGLVETSRAAGGGAAEGGAAEGGAAADALVASDEKASM